eukprot:gene400-1034_t
MSVVCPVWWDFSDCFAEKCLSSFHVEYFLSAITRESLDDLKVLSKTRCKHAAYLIDELGRTPLHIAVSCGRYDVAEWLVEECSVDIGQRDRDGWNALHRSLYYGNIHCAHGLDYSVHDKEGLSPLQLVQMDSRIEKDDFDKSCKSDVYVWGNNSNSVLGQPSFKNSIQHPELIDYFKTEKIEKSRNIDSYMSSQRPSNSGVKQVALSKYHSVFLCEDGSVFTCGHGRGGRLGHRDEISILSPTRIKALSGTFCTSIAAANDHTLVLDQMGQVYSFGLNTYHQLGHHPAPTQCLIPKMITHKSLKGKISIGIAAARFHSAIFTKNELFTFGLNAGQLGHSHGNELQSIPRLSLFAKTEDTDIAHVAVSDGATGCCMCNGDVYILQDYGYRKIAKRMMITKLVMSGGELESKLLTGLQNKDTDKLCVLALQSNGRVYCWKQGYQNFKDCAWEGKMTGKVVDISLGKHILFVTDDRVAFQGFFKGTKSSPTAKQGQESKTTPSKVVQTSSFSLTELAERKKRRKEEEEDIMVQRVPLIYRGHQVACDVKSRAFAVLQHDPHIGLNSCPYASLSSMDNDMHDLLNEADISDGIADVQIETKDRILPAHYFILASRLPLHDLEAVSRFDRISQKHVIKFKSYSSEVVKRWLTDLYNGITSKSLDNVNGRMGTIKEAKRVPANDLEGTSDDVIEAMTRFSLRDLDSPDVIDCKDNVDRSNTLVANGLHKLSKRGRKKKNQKEAQGKESTKHKNTARCDEPDTTARKGFPLWLKRPDLSDVIIESEDGIQFHCHRCILYARLDYFRGMFGNPWLEANWATNATDTATIRMQCPGNILKIILDYLYTDEALCLKGCSNISLLCDIIIYADQLLISRLKELCEILLSELISLKNVLEFFNFSCTYNAEQLKIVCCQYISTNLAFFLETRSLESLSSDVLTELSNVYKEFIPNMAYRRLTPSTFHMEVDTALEELLRLSEFEATSNGGCGQPILNEQDKTLPKEPKVESPMKKKKRRRRSSSAKDGSFSEDSVVVTASNDDLCKPVSPSFADGSAERGVGEPQGEPSLIVDDEDRFVRRTQRSFREIMEEEEKQTGKSQTKLNRVSLGERMDFGSMKKTSQKQRKQKSQSESSLNPRDVGPTKSEPVIGCQSTNQLPSCPWGKPADQKTAVKSLKDVIGEEIKNSTEKTRVEKSERKWKGIADSNVKTSESIWNGYPLATSPPPLPQSLSAIMEAQQEQKETSIKVLRKPLKLIQIEEKAIEELLIHYKAKDNPTNYITVERVKADVSSPIWKTDEHT